MSHLAKRIASIGTSPVFSLSRNRSILVSNYYAMAIFVLTIIIASTEFIFFDQPEIPVGIVLTGILNLLPIALNRWGFHTAARLFLCGKTVVGTMTLSVLIVILYPEQVDPNTFFDFRTILLGLMIVPLTLFSLKEKISLLIGVSFSFLSLALYDPIHNFFGVGYHQLGFFAHSYYYNSNFFPVLIYAFVLVGFLFIKHLQERTEEENTMLIDELVGSNKMLQQRNSMVEAQNIEIQTKTQQLEANQAQLMSALQTIEDHKIRLMGANSDLETEILEKNRQLLQANDDLSKYNEELRQFSYTISHNLRGPLSTLLGLTDLLKQDLDQFPESHQQLIKMTNASAIGFDQVIRDLTKIIDMKNEVHRSNEMVDLQKELDLIVASIPECKTGEVEIEAHLSDASSLFTTKSFLQSILFNLISNSVKFRSKKREPRITIHSRKENGNIVLTLADNGIGFDYNAIGDRVFMLYKRFHTGSEGRGLGLYIVKTQVELVGGQIAVESEEGLGTTFTITFTEQPDSFPVPVLN